MKKQRILLVEDTVEWQEIISDILREYHVDVASSYREAEIFLQKTAYDLFIVDMNLIDSNKRDRLGGKLLNFLKTTNYSTPRIMITGDSDPAIGPWMRRYELEDIFIKDRIDLERFSETVNCLLSQENLEVKYSNSIGITSNIFIRLRITLLNCPYFASHQELRSLFVDNRIHVWKDEIPFLDTPHSLVNAVIDKLYNQYNTKKQNGLVLLLQVLSDHVDSGDLYHHQLIELANELERERQQ